MTDDITQLVQVFFNACIIQSSGQEDTLPVSSIELNNSTGPVECSRVSKSATIFVMQITPSHTDSTANMDRLI